MALTDGLVHLWELDEGSGTRNDATANVHHLSTLTGTPSNAEGLIGNALSVDGSSSVSRSSLAHAFAGADVLNLSVWVYPTSIGTTQQAVMTCANAASATALFWRFQTNSNMRFSLVDTNASTRTVDNLAPSDNQWNHFFIRFIRNNGLYAYKNNAAPTIGTVGDFAYSTNTTSPSTVVAARSSVDRFIGRLDQLAIWTRDLSDDERTQLYNNGHGVDLLGAGCLKPLHSYSHRWGMLQTGAQLANALPVSALYTNRKAIFQAAALVSQSVPWYTELRRRVLVLGAGAVHELGGLPAARLRRSIWRT